MEILNSISIVTILIHISYSVPVDKLHKSDELPTFFINTQNKYSWFEAWNECAIRNMSLIAVDTIEKHKALENVLRKQLEKPLNLYLGGHDLVETGKFIWASTGKQFDFSNWKKGQPDNANSIEHCAHIWEKSDYEWNDAPCTAKLGYICEENRFVVAARKDFAIKKHFIYQLFEL